MYLFAKNKRILTIMSITMEKIKNGKYLNSKNMSNQTINILCATDANITQPQRNHGM